MTATYRPTLWSGDIDTFNEWEREIWDNANEKIYEPAGDEYFVVVRHQAYIPPAPEPEPKLTELSPATKVLTSLGRWILSVAGIIAVQLLFLLAVFALIIVVRQFIG